METFWNTLNYLVGVYIVERDDVLSIEDRRPTRTLVLAGAGVVTVIAVMSWGWLTNSLKLDAINFVFLGAGLVAALVFAVRGTFREIYIFDRTNDAFSFSRQSVFNKNVLEGSLSEFRGVQVQRRTDDENENYAVALLMQGMLLGRSDTQLLREKPPLLNSVTTEKRIAAAIGRFLKIPYTGVVDV